MFSCYVCTLIHYFNKYLLKLHSVSIVFVLRSLFSHCTVTGVLLVCFPHWALSTHLTNDRMAGWLDGWVTGWVEGWILNVNRTESRILMNHPWPMMFF